MEANPWKSREKLVLSSAGSGPSCIRSPYAAQDFGTRVDFGCCKVLLGHLKPGAHWEGSQDPGRGFSWENSVQTPPSGGQQRRPAVLGDAFWGRGVCGFVFKQYPVLRRKEDACPGYNRDARTRMQGLLSTRMQSVHRYHWVLRVQIPSSFPSASPESLTWVHAPCADPEQLCSSVAAAVKLSGSCGAEQSNEKGSLNQWGQ